MWKRTRSDCTEIFRQEYLPLLRSAGLGDYASIMASRGTDLLKPGLRGRKRTLLPLTGIDGQVQNFFLKRYSSSASARLEWQAIEAVRAAGVPTMEPVAMGTGSAGGFVLVSAVPGEALSRCMSDWIDRNSENDSAGIALAEGLGKLAGLLHAAGLAHRDFYTTHIFLHERGTTRDLYLIDLARVFRPRWRKWRWRAKDLAQLKFSLPQPWAEQYWSNIVTAYMSLIGMPLPRRVQWTIGARVRSMQRRRQRQSERR